MTDRDFVMGHDRFMALVRQGTPGDRHWVAILHVGERVVELHDDTIAACMERARLVLEHADGGEPCAT